MIDYFVRYIALPRCVEGFVTPNDDDTYSIYINSEIPLERQREALKHELEHLKQNHLYSLASAHEIEEGME